MGMDYTQSILGTNMYNIKSKDTFKLGCRGTVKVFDPAQLPSDYQITAGDMLIIDNFVHEVVRFELMRGCVCGKCGQSAGILVKD